MSCRRALTLSARSLSWCAFGALLATADFVIAVESLDHAAGSEKSPSHMSAEVIAFIGIKPGDKVADFLPNTQHFTNLFCNLVGDTGHVYVVLSPAADQPAAGLDDQHCAAITPQILRSRNFPAPELYNSSDDPGAVYEYYAARLPVESFSSPEPLDVIWMADAYHDLHTQKHGKLNLTYVGEALLKALKPGGALLIEDRAETDGLGIKQIKLEMTRVGFVFVGARQAWQKEKNGDNDQPEKKQKGTDRFLLKFLKPPSSKK